MRLLPIGSVVKLKKGIKPVMIYGRKQKRKGSDKIYDYLGCLYPEGHISKQYNIFFMQSNITKVLYKGYITPEEKRLRIKIKDL